MTLGYLNQDHQSDQTVLEIHWEGFSDIEETTPEGLIVHDYGIANYKVSVGEMDFVFLERSGGTARERSREEGGREREKGEGDSQTGGVVKKTESGGQAMGKNGKADLGFTIRM